MNRKADHMMYEKLHRRFHVLLVISGVMITSLVGCILFYRNPWLVNRLSAEKVTADVLKDIAQSPSPYVKIEGIDLSFTGYYKAGEDNKIYAYCYMGKIGDGSILIDLPAEDEGKLAENPKSDMAELKDWTIVGRIDGEKSMLTRLAEAEDMTVEEYETYFHVADMEIHVFDNHREQIKIYQLLVVVFAFGLLAAGFIFKSEADMILKDTKEGHE